MIAWPMWMISAAFAPKQWMPRICQRLAVEQQLEHADRLAGDLGAGQALELGVADFVGDAWPRSARASVLPTELISGLV